MTAYADYTYYTNTYLGTAIASEDFNKLALKASAYIDKITFGRTASQTDLAIIDKIKMATCAVAEEYQNQDMSGGEDAILTETVGVHSVTYRNDSSKSMTNDDKLTQEAELWLANTYLTFQGFTGEEYGCV